MFGDLVGVLTLTIRVSRVMFLSGTIYYNLVTTDENPFKDVGWSSSEPLKTKFLTIIYMQILLSMVEVGAFVRVCILEITFRVIEYC